MLIGLWLLGLIMWGLGDLMTWIATFKPYKTPEANERLHWFILACIVLPFLFPLLILVPLIMANSKKQE